MSDKQVSFQLRGWQALLAIPILIALALWRYHAVQTSIDDDLKQDLRTHLMGEYISPQLQEMQQAMDRRDRDRLESMSKSIIQPRDITFPELDARRKKKNEVLIRARIEVQGAPPPEGPEVRYFRFEYSPITGWRYGREIGVWSWRLAIIP